MEIDKLGLSRIGRLLEKPKPAAWHHRVQQTDFRVLGRKVRIVRYRLIVRAITYWQGVQMQN